jgi:TatD DNase family protein
MQLFDTHFHVYPEDDIPGVFGRAREAGVSRFAVIGTTLEESRFALGAIADQPGAVGTCGVHPHEAAGFDGDLGPFRELVTAGRVAAIGEVGLDYYYDHSPRECQRRVFARFADLAAQMGMPLVVHCRDAYEDCWSVLSGMGSDLPRLELHSYTGSVAWLERFLGLGAYVSVNGIVTFGKAGNVRDLVSRIPPERLLVETDSPFLAPVPHRGKRNEPAFVRHVVEAAAEVLGRSVEDTARLTFENGERFFGL